MSGSWHKDGDWVLVLRPARADRFGVELPPPMIRMKGLAKALLRPWGFVMVELVPGATPLAESHVKMARGNKAKWLNPVGSITKSVGRSTDSGRRAA